MLGALAAQHGLDLAARDQPLDIGGAADEHALHEYHGEGRPSGPHLEGVTAAPGTEVAAVFEVLVGNRCCIERLARFLGERVLLHPHHDDVVLVDRGAHFADEVSLMAGDLCPDGGMDVGFVENGAWHGYSFRQCACYRVEGYFAAPLRFAASRSRYLNEKPNCDGQ